MYETDLVDGGEPLGDIAEQRGDLDRGQRGGLVEPVREGVALDELHGNPRPAVGQEVAVVDPDDSRMANAIQDRGFLYDACRHAGLAPEISVHDLECSTTRQGGGPGFVYRGHSTSTDLSHNPIRTHQGVSAKFGEGLGGHGGCRCTNLARRFAIQDPADSREVCAVCSAGAKTETAASRAGTWRAPVASVVVSSQVDTPSVPD